MTRSPVLFLVFNRPDTTAQVFEAIRKARPPRLYVAADGHRANRNGEAGLCEQVRRLVTQVDWPCELKTLFRNENLGCKLAVSSAISWFFENEPEGIILEDDCLPHPDFFQYCDELLERYRHDERIGVVSGTSLVDMRKEGLNWLSEDYAFSRYPSVWGWASWARVWRDYDVAIEAWDERREDVSCQTHNPRLRKINDSLFDRVRAGKIDTWDYQVSFLLWATSRLAIVPRFNLIENIGFGPGATHTTNARDALSACARTQEDRVAFPLVAPQLHVPNRRYQQWVEAFAARPLMAKLYERFLSYVRR